LVQNLRSLKVIPFFGHIFPLGSFTIHKKEK
jgi:hypothetical protein